MRRSGEPIEFDRGFIDDLRERADQAFSHFADRLGTRSLFVTKHVVASVLECEVHHLQPDDFAWTPARARGQVSHKAIQLMLHWRGEPSPMDLVDEAMARLVDEERDFGRWVGGLDEADTADLRGQAVDRVTKFAHSFPPLDSRQMLVLADTLYELGEARLAVPTYQDYLDIKNSPHVRNAVPVIYRGDLRLVSEFGSSNGYVDGSEPHFYDIRRQPIAHNRNRAPDRRACRAW